MIRFRLDIAGEVQMDRGIARFADGVTDYRAIWPVIEDEFYALEARQFATEGEEGGGKWQELSEPYGAWKAMAYPGKAILERTGALKASLTSESGAGGVHVRERKTLTLGTMVPYAIYHQSIAPRKVLPRRPEIQLTEQFKRLAMKNIHQFLVQMAVQCGFRAGLAPLDVSRLLGVQQRRQRIWEGF